MPLILRNLDNKLMIGQIELYNYFPDFNELIKEKPDVLGINILLPKLIESENQRKKNPGSESTSIALIKYHNPQLEPQHVKLQFEEVVKKSITEAINHLTIKGYICAERDRSILDGGNFNITKMGYEVGTQKDPASYAKANNYHWELLHSEIREIAKAGFRIGNYDNAVSNSFRKVEDYARDSFNLDKKLYSKSLLSKAFPSDSKMRNLFQSALEIYRNDNVGHACPKIEAQYAFHQVMFASLLLSETDKYNAK